MTDTVAPPTPVSPKVTASAAASAVITAVSALAALFGLDLGLGDEGEVARLVLVLGSVLTVAQAATGYLKRDPLRG